MPNIDLQTILYGLRKFRPNLLVIPKYIVYELLTGDKLDLSGVKCVISGGAVV